ncbi:MAG: substrate binding domain-containing protein, partial [Lentisphaeraceae bacterium]|nr:substrate binding domain-containing protein [Lentisphaeraceae bacterium]
VIRNAPLNDSSFIARELAADHRILAASPAYLKAHGTPSKPEDLKSHMFVTFGGSQQLKFKNGQTLEVANSSSVNDGEAMRLMIENGMGIAVKAIWNIKESLEAGSLVEVLPKFPLITDASIWALYPSGRMVPQKVRAMIDFLLEKFTPTPPWDQ